MELNELRKAIERYQDTRRNIDEFLTICGDEVSLDIRAILGNHHYYITSQIREVEEVLHKLEGLT